MYKFFLVLLATSIVSTTRAQQKILSMEDAMLKARTTLAPETLSQLQFYGNTTDFVYITKRDGKEVWMRGGKSIRTDSVFLTLERLNTQLQGAGISPLTSVSGIRFTADGWIFNDNGNRTLYNPITRKTRVLLSRQLINKENADASTTGYTAWLENYNLFVAGPGDVNPVQVTTDGSRDIVYASSVHREEFGISKGTFWSNGGTKLAFYRMDQSMVTDYPIINWTERPAKVELIKYPMAGDKSHHVTVGVYNANENKTIWLQTGEPAEQYLTNIAWSPDDRYVYIAIVNREQNHCWLNQYDAATGKFIKTLFEETDSKYVEPLVPMSFLRTKPGQFIWQSNRDGWNHLYLYDTSGKMIRQLTKGNWEVLEVKGWDPREEQLYFVATNKSPVDRTLNMLSMKTGSVTPLTNQSGIHATQVSTDGTAILDVYSTIDIPRNISYIELKKGMPVSRTLLQAANPLKDYATGQLSLFTLPNKQGDSIYCRMYKPVSFDAGKKYPVIVYWYGGPHAQLILNSWNGGAGDYWFQYMAEQGYVVFSIDTRGSDNRGKQFEQSIFRRLGDAQMEDMMTAVDYLSNQSFVDKDRMGLFGWSFGGFMTTDFMLNHPSVFKAAVAGGPVMNWQYYEIMYGERYMDMPQENPDGYAATNLIKQAGKLKGHLLLIHGLQDPVVVQENSVNFVKACVDNKVQVDYMIYPGHEHNVIGPDRAHLYQKVTDYFSLYLQ